ncbi:MAG: type II toxin-antitoxin system VapC family toxin [Geminicoccaceae bacterium]
MTNLLLDTHVMVWCVFKPELLSRTVEQEILHARRVFVPSPALYEAVRAIVSERVKGTSREVVEALPDLIETSGFELLHADERDWIEAAGLGWSHGDPFDRLIYAMANLRSLALITADTKLLKLGGKALIDAR